ncbi:MAG: hypothetical protein ABJQ78_15865 [Alloalcanivorax sp.]|jgi:hypothetical protein
MRKALRYLLLVQALLVTPTQAEWGNYQRFTAVEGVVMYISYNSRKHCTDVAWKAENTSNFAVLPAIEDKQYTCRTGQVEHSDSTGTLHLLPGNSSIPQRDHCVCEGQGGIMQTHATVNVSKL